MTWECCRSVSHRSWGCSGVWRCGTSTQQFCTELQDRSPPKTAGEGFLETLKRDKPGHVTWAQPSVVPSTQYVLPTPLPCKQTSFSLGASGSFCIQSFAESRSAALTWEQDTLHCCCSRAARIFLPSTELSIQSSLVNWSTDHMLFQANDDIRECNPWVATAAAPGKHSLCYSNKREEESFQNSPSLCPSWMIFLLLASGFMVNIRARYCCHWDLVNLA